jgi:hypothetical protein
MAEQTGGGFKPSDPDAQPLAEQDIQDENASALVAREALPSYARFNEPVTKVDNQIERRIVAMRADQPPNEDTSTDVRLLAQGGRPAAASTAAMIPPAPLPPTLGAALRQAVRFAGGELPLWGVLLPAFVAAAIVVSLAAAAATAREVVVPAPSDVAAASASALASAAPVASEVPEAPPAESAAAPDKPLTLAERAASGQEDALDKLESKPAPDLTVEEALAIAAGRGERDLNKARALREKLADDPALVKNSDTLTELYGYTQDPTTAREALAVIANLPGPIGADMLYEVWAGTPAKNETTELARSLLLGKTIRAKASPALSVVLDLRAAERCEDALALMPRVQEEGDKRSLTTLTRMQRRSGCGANKRLDCYPCLRKGSDLKDALKAIKQRREPQPFRG